MKAAIAHDNLNVLISLLIALPTPFYSLARVVIDDRENFRTFMMVCFLFGQGMATRHLSSQTRAIPQMMFSYS